MTVTPEDRLGILETAFSPSAPITSRDLFAGRSKQIQRTCDAINERGQHFVVYGDRGVGKTSLANVIESHLSGVVVSKITCNRSETFRHVWEKAFSKIRFRREPKRIGFTPEAKELVAEGELLLPDRDLIDSLDIQHILEGVNEHLLFLFDEFDSISSSEVQVAFADTIKALSDNASHVTVGIVGIADDVDHLIGHHPSLERCLKQIRMPRMSKVEIEEILMKALDKLIMRADVTVISRIVDLSLGFPHYTHLLGKFAAKRAISDGVDEIRERHLEGAIHDALENADQSIKTAYSKATHATKPNSKFEDVVGACTLVGNDESNMFAPKDLIEPYHHVTGAKVLGSDLTYTLQKLCESERGKILERHDTRSGQRYRFSSPLMCAYARLRLQQKGSFSSPTLI